MTAATPPLRVGEELTPFERRPGFAHWNRFAAVNDEFVPIHMDDEAGRAAGFPGAIGMGRLHWSYLHNLLRALVGTRGRIVSLHAQFRSPQHKDVVARARGRVTAVTERSDGWSVTLDVWVEDAHGTVLAPGTAMVTLPPTL